MNHRCDIQSSTHWSCFPEGLHTSRDQSKLFSVICSLHDQLQTFCARMLSCAENLGKFDPSIDSITCSEYQGHEPLGAKTQNAYAGVLRVMSL